MDFTPALPNTPKGLKRTHLVWGKCVVEDTSCLMNIYSQNFIAFKFWVDTEIFSKQESALLDKQEKWGLNLIVIFAAG